MTFAEALSVGLSLLALVFVVSGRVAAKATWDETPPLAYAWEQRRAAVVTGLFELLVGIGVLLRRHQLAARLAPSSRGGTEHADGDRQ